MHSNGASHIDVDYYLPAIKHTRAEIESARVDANREFFDKFEEIVEKDAVWAYNYIRTVDQKNKDPLDFYLEIKEREETRRKKGLPPHVVLLPGWDKDDEKEVKTRKRFRPQMRNISRKRPQINPVTERRIGVSHTPGTRLLDRLRTSTA